MDCTCGLNTCYDCRRQAIDATAERIYHQEIKLCTGIEGLDVEAHAARMANDWRCDMINRLAFEFVGL